MKRIKIYLADDHAILRDGLKSLLLNDKEIDIVGDSGDGRIAIAEIEKLKPDVAVFDISMPGISGLEASRQIRRYNKDIKIIILSRHENEEYVKEALTYGVNGYILKDYAGEDMIRALREVMEGNVYLSPKLVTMMTKDFISSDSFHEKRVSDDQSLTAREKEILKLIAEGISGSEIASILRISAKTVKVHRLNIMKKLDFHNVTELVKYAIKNNLIEI